MVPDGGWYFTKFRYARTWFVDLILVCCLYPNYLHWIQLLVLTKITKVGWRWCMEHPRKKATRINVLTHNGNWSLYKFPLIYSNKICPSIKKHMSWFEFRLDELEFFGYGIIVVTIGKECGRSDRWFGQGLIWRPRVRNLAFRTIGSIEFLVKSVGTWFSVQHKVVFSLLPSFLR